MGDGLHVDPDVVAHRCVVRQPDYSQLTPLDWVVLDFADGTRSYVEMANALPVRKEDLTTSFIHLRLLGFLTWQKGGEPIPSRCGTGSSASVSGFGASGLGVRRSASGGQEKYISSGASASNVRGNSDQFGSPISNSNNFRAMRNSDPFGQPLSSTDCESVPRSNTANRSIHRSTPSSFGASGLGFANGISRFPNSVPKSEHNSPVRSSDLNSVLRDSVLNIGNRPTVALDPPQYPDDVCAQYIPERLFTDFRRFVPTLADSSLDIPVEMQFFTEFIYDNLQSLSSWDLLGLSENSDKSALKSAFVQRSRLFHPDRYFHRNIGPFGPRIAAIFKAIMTAYTSLQQSLR